MRRQPMCKTAAESKRARRIGRRNAAAILLALALGTTGQVLPASAHSRTIQGTTKTASPNSGTNHWLNIDFMQYQANGCQDIVDGIGAVVINVVSWRNHRATVKAISQSLKPIIGYGACRTADAFTEGTTLTEPGVVLPGQSRSFVIPQGATYLLIENHPSTGFGGASYQLDFTHPS